MSSKKRKKLSPVQQQYQDFAHAREPKRPLLKNCLKAFILGGIICTIGQGVQWVFMNCLGFDEEAAGSPTVAVMIILSVLLTSFGVYDHIAQWGGAGSAVPVTGFAYTIASAALEHKSEGYVLGVGGNMFKIARARYRFWYFFCFCCCTYQSDNKVAGRCLNVTGSSDMGL